MLKAKTTERLLIVALTLGCTAVQAQGTLGEMIDKAKQSKQRELQSPGVATAEASPPPAPVLWAIEGVNGKLTAQIWYDDKIHRLPIEPGAQLHNQWRVVSGDAQQVVMAKGRKTLTLKPQGAGSTGWEFPQAARTVGMGGLSNTMPPSMGSNARAAASNLPGTPLPPAALPPSTNSPPR